MYLKANSGAFNDHDMGSDCPTFNYTGRDVSHGAG